MDDYRKIGIGLTAAGMLFFFLGIMLLFDKGLLAMGNVRRRRRCCCCHRCRAPAATAAAAAAAAVAAAAAAAPRSQNCAAELRSRIAQA